jgi:hypothetical protein
VGGDGKRRIVGGKGNPRGTPQGGVASPLLANIYMNRFLKHWRLSGCGEAFRAHVVSYADDFVILSRGRAAEALAWTKAVMTRLGLTINEAKTSLKNARQERFNFLGYSFGPHWFKANGKWYLGASPCKKSVQRLKTKVHEVRDTLNRPLRGWSNYFCYGTRGDAFRSIDHYVTERVRAFLARRHKVQGRPSAPSYRAHPRLYLQALPGTAPSDAADLALSRRGKGGGHVLHNPQKILTLAQTAEVGLGPTMYLMRRGPDVSINRPASRAAHGQDKKTTRDREVLLEMQQLIVIGKLRVEEHRGEHAEDRKQRCRNPRERAGDNKQPATELERYDRRQQHAGHAEPLHVGRGAAVAADEAPSLVHEDEGQQQPTREQASCGWPAPHCM